MCPSSGPCFRGLPKINMSTVSLIRPEGEPTRKISEGGLLRKKVSEEVPRPRGQDTSNIHAETHVHQQESSLKEEERKGHHRRPIQECSKTSDMRGRVDFVRLAGEWAYSTCFHHITQ